MALPALNATFASSANLPRKQMLAKWLVEELGETQAPSNVLVSNAGSDINGVYAVVGEQGGRPYYERQDGENISWTGDRWIVGGNIDGYESLEDVAYPWLVESWVFANGEEPLPLVTEVPAPSPISNYYSLPERYLWAKIAVAAGGPKTEADYISLPTRYVWSDIYNAVSGDIAQSTVVVSGLSEAILNGKYVFLGIENNKPSYQAESNAYIYWEESRWVLYFDGSQIASDSDVAYPWLAINWYNEGIDPTGLVMTPQTPNHTDWTENVALGHIAAAYRGDTANPANLATYIDWPWRYKVASVIDHLIGNYNAVIVSGAGTTTTNGTYVYNSIWNDRKKYVYGSNFILWNGTNWYIYDSVEDLYTYLTNNSDTINPWDSTFFIGDGENPAPTLTPTNV